MKAQLFDLSILLPPTILQPSPGWQAGAACLVSGVASSTQIRANKRSIIERGLMFHKRVEQAAESSSPRKGGEIVEIQFFTGRGWLVLEKLHCSSQLNACPLSCSNYIIIVFIIIKIE